MPELVRSRVAGGAAQCVSLGLAAQLGGPRRGQVVADGGVHAGLLVVWMVVLGRLDDAQRIVAEIGRVLARDRVSAGPDGEVAR